LISKKYITASCIISGNIVYKNGKPVFENKEVAMPAFLVSAYQHLATPYPRFYKMDNLSKLGWLAAEILLKDSFNASAYEPGEVGVVLTNASSSLDTDVKYYETAKDIPSPALFVYTLPNIVIGEICIRHHFKGENAFFIAEAFDGGFIEHYVSNLINNNILQSCICGWVELLEGSYKAALYLVEKEESVNSVIFTKENITQIYQLQNG
jgi:hypothetical protein